MSWKWSVISTKSNSFDIFNLKIRKYTKEIRKIRKIRNYWSDFILKIFQIQLFINRLYILLLTIQVKNYNQKWIKKQ